MQHLPLDILRKIERYGSIGGSTEFFSYEDVRQRRVTDERTRRTTAKRAAADDAVLVRLASSPDWTLRDNPHQRPYLLHPHTGQTRYIPAHLLDAVLDAWIAGVP